MSISFELDIEIIINSNNSNKNNDLKNIPKNIPKHKIIKNPNELEYIPLENIDSNYKPIIRTKKMRYFTL